MKLFKALIVALLVIVMNLKGVAYAAETYPVFRLAWSEYPSWSVFGVAHKYGLINGNQGEYGPIEHLWKVDIVLQEAEYDPCIQMYGTGQVDAVCMTNMDSLQPSLRFKTVGILPTSTSYGADAAIVDKIITEIKDLIKYPTYGLERSVTQYAFVRNLKIAGEDPSQYQFLNMDPGAAAMAMQQKDQEHRSIMVWNPFVLETLDKRPDVRVIFDTRTIPAEIIDLVAVSQKSLNREGGDRFACAVIETFYAVVDRMNDPATKDETLISIGEKFSHLNLESMKKVVKQTRFYETLEQAYALFTGGTAFPGGKVATEGNFPQMMKKIVVPTAVEIGMADKAPTIGYGAKAEAGDVQLRFDPTYIKTVMEKRSKK